MKEKNFVKKAMWVAKNAEFDADFESAEKAAKNSCEKSYKQKSDRKMELLTFFILCAKVFCL
jgi:hypothetical protein